MKPEHLGLDASGMPDGLNAENHPVTSCEVVYDAVFA